MRIVIKSVWLTAVVSLVSLALVINLARVTLPAVGDYKKDIEQLISESLGHPLSIGDIQAHMNGWYPSLRLNNVSMLDKENAEPLLFFQNVEIDLDVWASLRNWRPEFARFALLGLDLAVEKDEQGKFSVAGVQGKGKSNSSTQMTDVLAWFLSKEKLLIEQATVRWRDYSIVGEVQVFTDLGFSLINQGAEHKLVGQGFLPGRYGRSFDFLLKFQDVQSGRFFSGDGYVRANGAQLSPWQAQLFGGDKPGYAVDGQFDAQVWFVWHEGHLLRMDASLHNASLSLLAPNSKPLVYDDVRMQASWRHSPTGWLAVVDEFSLHQGQQAWDFSGVELRFSSQDDSARYYELGMSSVPVAPVSEIALHVPLVGEAAKQFLIGAQPHAKVNNVYARWVVGAERKSRFFVRADILQAAVSAYQKIPGVNRLDSVLYADNEQWLLDVDSHDVVLDFTAAGLFRDPLTLSRLEGVVQGDWAESSWRVWTDSVNVVNEHFSANTALTLGSASSVEEGAVLDLVVSVENADAQHVSKYLPVGIMHESVVNWLDRSIVGAKVPAAGVTFRGPLKSFPFDDRHGRFEVQVELQEGVLNYMPDWPPIVDIRGQLAFNEQSMTLQGQSAMTLDSRLSNVHVSIPKFKADDLAVYVKGHAKGPTKDGLLFLTTTPLKTSVGSPFMHASSEGASVLDLDLRIPLNSHETDVTLNGDVLFQNSKLIFNDLGLDITEVNGALNFSEKHVAAESLQARVLGFATQAKLSTVNSSSGERQIIVEAHGKADAKQLLDKFHVAVLKDLRGIVPWQGEVVLPLSGAAPQLTIRSKLEGVVVDVPSPLGKRAEESKSLQLDMKFPFNAQNLLRLNYGDALLGAFELTSDNDSVHFKRGEIRYAVGEPSLPHGKGLRIVGRFKHYDHDQWMAYVSRLQGDDEGTEEGDSLLAELIFYFDEALLFGQTTRNVNFELVEVDKRLLGEFFSSAAAGHFVIPKSVNESIAIDLDYLFYQSTSVAETTSEESTNPREIPPLNLTVNHLYRDGELMGRLDLALLPDASNRGVNISRVDLHGPNVDVRLTGDWLVDADNEQTTSLKGDIDSGNMGALLGALGFVDNLKSGQAKNSLNVVWDGGLGDFALERLRGDVLFDIRSGTLLDVSPGAGRIFGLLSVQALPRRLSLDFSDLFGKGLAFDVIRGRVQLNKGEAFTDDFELKGPAAEVSITGYIDLVGKQYNQYVTLEPNVTGTLPLAVAVIANPAAGVAAWFAEKLLKRPVNDIAKILYHVTGSWQAPEIKRLGRIDYYGQPE